MADPDTSSPQDKIAYFQAVTGLTDPDLASDILTEYNWDLELAISTFTSNPEPPSTPPRNPNPPSNSSLDVRSPNSPPNTNLNTTNPNQSPTLAWKLITLPFYVVSGAFSVAFWITGGVLNRLGVLGFQQSPYSAEATAFVQSFNRDFVTSEIKPNFVAEGFMEALSRSQREFKLMFVYLHSPDHPDVPGFCTGCLCNQMVAEFVNENFVVWGGSVRGVEGFKMSNSFNASRFPFCAVVMAAANQRLALLSQIEGPRTPEEMINILQQVVEQSGTQLVTARLAAEERMNNTRLREQQDAEFLTSLQADQARERQRKEEQDRLEREAAEVERKHKEEEAAKERAIIEAAEKQAALVRRKQEKTMLLGEEPEKGSDVTQVLFRFPNGERKERRFKCNAPIESLYDYVDSLGFMDAEKYSLVSNFPRVIYGAEKYSVSLKEAGLHPQASLFVEIQS